MPQPCQTCWAVCGSTRMGRCPGAACAAETAGEAVDGGKAGIDDGGIVAVACCLSLRPNGHGRPTIGSNGSIAMQGTATELDLNAERRRE